MAWRTDPRTGERVWVNDGDQATLGATEAPAEAYVQDAPASGFRTGEAVPLDAIGQGAPQSGFGGGDPQPTEPTSYAGPYGTEPIRQAIGNRIANSAWGGMGSTSDLTSSRIPPGVVMGITAGEHGRHPPPPLSFGGDLRPEDQQYLEALTNLSETLGSTPTITAPQLPEVPAGMFEADPGLQTLADHATRRQGQVDELIAELRAGRENDVNRTTNKWVTLGRWLSDWSATNDPTQAGAAMSRVLRDNDDMRQELRHETLQYVQMGMSAEDAVIQAQAALLSGQAEARRQLAAAQYQRATGQTQMDFNAQVATTEAAGRGASARANALVTIAEAQRAAAERGREERNRTAGILSNDPRYSNQAFGELSRNTTSDPATQDALTNTMIDQQQNMALMNYIVSAQGSRDRNALQFLRQWDPSLNEDALRRSTPQALMMRLTRTPAARAAFDRNRDQLIRSMQFGGMSQPAQ